MHRYSRFRMPEKIIQTVYVGGVYITEKRIVDDRRHKTVKCPKEYDRRLYLGSESIDRRRQSIDIVI